MPLPDLRGAKCRAVRAAGRASREGGREAAEPALGRLAARSRGDCSSAPDSEQLQKIVARTDDCPLTHRARQPSQMEASKPTSFFNRPKDRLHRDLSACVDRATQGGPQLVLHPPSGVCKRSKNSAGIRWKARLGDRTGARRVLTSRVRRPGRRSAPLSSTMEPKHPATESARSGVPHGGADF